MNRSWSCSFVAMLIVLAGGCGQRVPLVPVTGVVVVGTVPVEGAEVTFLNDAPGQPPASATTDGAGRFRMKTYWPSKKQEVDGASPGTYRVVVSKVSWPQLGTSTSRDLKSLNPPAATNVLPERYRNANTSGLSAEVRQGEANDFTFTLE